MSWTALPSISTSAYQSLKIKTHWSSQPIMAKSKSFIPFWSRQFKLLCAKDRTSYLFGALKSSCKRVNKDMIKYLLSRQDQLFHVKWRNVIRRKIFDLHLGQEEDDIVDYLIDDDNHPNDFYLGDYEKDLKKSFFGTTRDRRIRRQEIVWIMKNCKIDRKEVCSILDVDPALLESCIGNPETVGELLDEWLDNEERFVDIEYEVREFPLKRGLESYYHYSTHKLHWRPEVIAARSGRADIVELFLMKAKMKYPTIDILFSGRTVPWVSPNAVKWMNSERCSRQRYGRIMRAWMNLICTLAHEQISDVSVLRCLPVEAFTVDGIRPQDLDTDSFHRLPFFFLTQKRGMPGTDKVRALLNTALQRGYPEIFNFYLDKYEIHDDQIKITGNRRWYILPEDKDWYPFEDEDDQWLGGVQWNEMNEGPCPIDCLSMFPTSLIVQHLDRSCFSSMILRGDVRTIQSLNQHYDALDKADASFLHEILRFSNKSRMPIPALEYICDYYHHDKHDDAEVRCRNVRRSAVKELITAPGKFTDGSEMGILYSREVLRIILSRFYPGRDFLEDYRTQELSDDEDEEFEITAPKIFKAAREAKARRYVGGGQDIPLARMTKSQLKQYNRIVKGRLKDREARYETFIEDFERETAPYRGTPYITSLHREKLLTSTLWQRTTHQMGLLISAMELHDFRVDFGPSIGDIGMFESWADWMSWEQWTVFLRDFILGLCGSRQCFIYWPDSLNCMTSTRSTLKKVLLHHRIYELLANTGVVIVDTDFYNGENLAHLPNPFPAADRDYLEALSKEHPEITAQRRNLTLAARCRIVIHESLRRSPGFQSDKIRSFKLPEILERFLLFSDLKDNWDNLNYHKRIMRETSLGK